MKKQAGVWIATKKAVIIFPKKNSSDIKIVDSSIEGRERVAGEKKLGKSSRFEIQFSNFETKKENRKIHEVQNYFKEVVNEIKDADEVVLFGPAEMKTELEKFILNESLQGPVIKRVETAESMTQNQMVAWVKKFYQTN
jgi:stalled ribosome rescue protein Dom34